MCAHTLGKVITQEAKLVPISAYTFLSGAESCANSVSQRRSGTPLRSFSPADRLQRLGVEEARPEAGVIDDEVELGPVARRLGQVGGRALLRAWPAPPARAPCGCRC
jgi:hypothetical protein